MVFLGKLLEGLRGFQGQPTHSTDPLFILKHVNISLTVKTNSILEEKKTRNLNIDQDYVFRIQPFKR